MLLILNILRNHKDYCAIQDFDRRCLLSFLSSISSVPSISLILLLKFSSFKTSKLTYVSSNTLIDLTAKTSS